MAASSTFNKTKLKSIILFLFISSTCLISVVDSIGTDEVIPEECLKSAGSCHNFALATKLKFIAISSILVASVIGVSLPLFSKSVPALNPDTNLFVIVKAFASGVILATGYMHVLPDSFACLNSLCLPKYPWRTFPFTTFIAMYSAIFTLMVDSFAMSYYRKYNLKIKNGVGDHPLETGHNNQEVADDNDPEVSQLMRYRVVAQVLELGIVVHSVVIGLSMGASDNPCTIKPLIAALCFHQLFEGMGLGGCILQADYGRKTNAIMVFFFSTTTPFGIAVGMAISRVYSENSATALIVVGVLNAISAGLLNYMALVELLGADFMGPKLQRSVKLQFCAYAAVLLGAGGMSIMALWA